MDKTEVTWGQYERFLAASPGQRSPKSPIWGMPEAHVSSSSDNPAGPAAGTRRVMRGGGWMNASSLVRTAYRQGVDPGWPGPMIGFRCAQDDRKARRILPALLEEMLDTRLLNASELA